MNRDNSLLGESEPMPDDLLYALEQARIAVVRDPNHILTYGQIISILSLFGPRWHRPRKQAEFRESLYEMDESLRLSLLGWRRRAWNSILCAQKVLYYWEQIRECSYQDDLRSVDSEFYDVEFIGAGPMPVDIVA